MTRWSWRTLQNRESLGQMIPINLSGRSIFFISLDYDNPKLDMGCRGVERRTHREWGSLSVLSVCFGIPTGSGSALKLACLFGLRFSERVGL